MLYMKPIHQRQIQGKVKKLKLEEVMGVAQFILNLQNEWRVDMGAPWNKSTASQSLIKLMLKPALPEEVQALESRPELHDMAYLQSNYRPLCRIALQEGKRK